ncbi:hypothetical protein MLD38_023231 [Melastoma candidum]|uniref:Uncharacterized protein n=1 Tax=Melastoma candidum TaxID=119954 RepID=A0ACB9QNM7_9MYRT|nr:hypothetical protein MLD38_023231 [Melastoma candidum]
MAVAAASRRVIGNCLSRKAVPSAIGCSPQSCATSSSSSSAAGAGAGAAAESSPKIQHLPKRRTLLTGAAIGLVIAGGAYWLDIQRYQGCKPILRSSRCRDYVQISSISFCPWMGSEGEVA